VIQADELGTGLEQLIVAMISSRLFRASHPSRVLIEIKEAGDESGLLTDSVVMTDNLATVFLQAIDRRIGSIPMGGVDSALRHTLSI
jgi:mRNA interferase MazF